MAANELAIANQALHNLGESRLFTSPDGTVASIAETDDPRAIAMIAFYGQARKMTLRAWPWPFAVKTALLTEDSDGSGTTWDEQWERSYDIPTDCLQALKFLTDTGPTQLDPPRFVMGVNPATDITVIYSDVDTDEANLEYIEDVSDTTRFTPEFDAALAWRLAFDIAMTVGADEKLREFALKNWGIALSIAQRVEANQSTPHKTFVADGSFTLSRFI